MKPIELPEGFISMIRGLGLSDAERLLTALAGGEASQSIRANGLKGYKPAPGHSAVPWLADRGIYLDERPIYAADPAWHQGLYYVQDASSMVMTAIVGELIEKYFEGRPVHYLDACAAPGGKTISAIESLPEGSSVLANEYDRRRASALLENVAKHGYPAVAISCGDAAALGSLGPVFDIVAVDAPCSGEGMMRKEPEAVQQWSEGLVKSCSAIQRDILAGVWKALRPGGFMIYSTCTFNRAEDEDNVAYIIDELGGKSIALGIGQYEGIQGAVSGKASCYRFMPGFVRGEGLFVAVVRKTDGENEIRRRDKAKNRTSKIPAEVSDFARRHITDAGSYDIIPTGKDAYSAIPKADAAFFGLLAEKLHLLRCGLPLCTIKGRDAVPSPELAFSTALAADSFPSLEADYSQAMAYLHGDSLTDIPDSLPKGYATVNYRGTALGFIKNIGRRANNLYPDGLRLRISPDGFIEPEAKVYKK